MMATRSVKVTSHDDIKWLERDPQAVIAIAARSVYGRRIDVTLGLSFRR